MHSRVEQKPELRFVLTGSSAHKLRHRAANLLGGRLVAQHLRALCQLRADSTTLRFWRTRSGLEVDFVVYGPNLFQAIEVTRATRVTAADLKGLKAFQTDDPEATCLLLSFCPEPLLIDGIRCEPLEGWLRRLRP